MQLVSGLADDSAAYLKTQIDEGFVSAPSGTGFRLWSRAGGAPIAMGSVHLPQELAQRRILWIN